jgi:hypothetical protein
MWLHVTFTFKIVHRRGADRTRNHPVLIEHRKLNDHPIEIEAPHLVAAAALRILSTLKEFHCATLIGRCQRRHFDLKTVL